MHGRIILSALAIASIGILLACGRGGSKAARDRARGDILARVNGVPITRTDIRIASRSEGHPGVVPESERNVLEGLVQQELEAQRAVELGLDPGDDYRAELARMEAQVAAFKRRKLSEAFERQEVAPAADVSEDALRKFFDENSGRLRAELHVFQILLHEEAAIEEAHRQISEGKPFEDVARRLLPNAPKSAERFWDLGYLHWNQIPPQWRSALERMQPGETSGVIKGPKNRFWIVKLVDRREKRDLTFESVKPMLAERLKTEKAASLRSQRLADLRARAKIEYAKADAAGK
jgi:parvulin-like peptidyl-prolyl isomerase